VGGWEKLESKSFSTNRSTGGDVGREVVTEVAMSERRRLNEDQLACFAVFEFFVVKAPRVAITACEGRYPAEFCSVVIEPSINARIGVGVHE
jgi:hypothetical protein